MRADHTTINRKTMKNKTDFFLPMLLIVAIGLAFSTYKFYGERKALKKKVEQLEHTVSNIGKNEMTTTTVKTDKGDVTVASVEPLKATDKNIGDRYGREMEVVREASGAKKKDVDNLSSVGVTTSDSVTVPVTVEPFGGLTTHFSDDFTTIDVRIDSMKTAAISYEVRDSLVIVSWAKRHSILFGLIKWKSGKRRIEAFSKNPKSTISSFEVLERLE